MYDHTDTPVATANEVVTAEVKVAQKTGNGEGDSGCDCGRSDRNLDKSRDCGCADSVDTDRTRDKHGEETSTRPMTPDAKKLAQELYKNLTMGCDSYLHMLPRVEDNRIKTDMTAAMCYYEKTIGKVKQYLLDHGAEPEERGSMARMAAHAGIAMNTAMDHTNSHIAEMIIEGATMSITTAEKLSHHAEGKAGCEDLMEICRDWARFEQNHIDAVKKYL